MELDLSSCGIEVRDIRRNMVPAVLYEDALRNETATKITDSGAIAITSGEKTGRSPRDKRIAKMRSSSHDIWWGSVNLPIDQHTFEINRERARDYLNTCDHLYVVDGYAGWDPRYRIKVRVICERVYHALFMRNMLIRLTDKELENFGQPDYVVYNAGMFPANRHTTYMSSKTSIDISFEDQEIVILGTQYAGEMKKGIFTIMHYVMPQKGILSMHCSANQGAKGDVSLFFGLSGTGKTTLSADPNRSLIGDDEHCWSDDGIFNIEGGCYAKVIDLSADREPEILEAIRFGSVLENVVVDPVTHAVDYTDTSLTENTRACFPIEYMRNAKIPCVARHPSNIIFLAFDAFGFLPPVSRLTPEQVMYHFISGYTAKVAGTEVGVHEPVATFSACFGAAFLVWHPAKYAELLATKMRNHKVNSWLVNTGIVGDGNQRIKLRYTRAIIDAIHSGALLDVPTVREPIFDLEIPTNCPGVPDDLLFTERAWSDPDAYQRAGRQLSILFSDNFAKFSDRCAPEVISVSRKILENETCKG
ncbi:MAG: phosphoenolpyruvate carboxykinase (ATP) [Bacteroidota bacterium]|nr:phosphoenolpyruvate carboxykinase (ATP) [Bacteroidota bacterium]